MEEVTKSPRRLPSLAKINNVLLGLIILITGYIIIAPLAPMATYWWGEHFGHTSQHLQKQIQARQNPTGGVVPPPVPQGEHLLVPTMQLDADVLEGTSIYTVNKGIWHRPKSSSPDKGGNTVLVGHRFTYTNPRGIFYYLNKVKIGDNIALDWNGVQYEYKVREIKEVPPTDLSVEANTTNPQLTLYTCTPLWAPHDRLVVIADLESRA